MKITQQYAKDMSNFLCSQLDVEIAHKAYSNCKNIEHIENGCNCKEIYSEIITTNDNSFESYLSDKIYEFIEFGE